jgi:protein-S-isoprenylcysteine O-methyltransferase Ste14
MKTSRLIYDQTSPDYTKQRKTVNFGLYSRRSEMAAQIQSQTQLEQPHADTMTRIGAWLFRRRTVISIPFAVALLVIPASPSQQSGLVTAGAVLVALGEAIRLWGVRHIGAISRTRSDRLGRLVASGPFALVRNPLYLGNVVLWIGFAITARLPWLAPPLVAILAFEYHAIVRWEERLLEARLGERFRAYAARVPRWVPNTINRKARGARRDQNLSAGSAVSAVTVFSWRETFYSERGTLIAIAIGFVLLWLKAYGSWLMPA